MRPPTAGARSAHSSSSRLRRFLPTHDRRPFSSVGEGQQRVGRAASWERPAQVSQGGPMFRRRSKIDKAKRAVAGRLPTTEEVRGQVAEVTDELSDALEAAREAITKAMSSAS